MNHPSDKTGYDKVRDFLHRYHDYELPWEDFVIVNERQLDKIDKFLKSLHDDNVIYNLPPGG